MTQACTVCAHPESNAITSALLHHAKSWKDLVKEYGISHAALGRHRKHVIEGASVVKGPSSQALQRTHNAIGVLTQANQLVSEIAQLKRRTDQLCVTAETTGDARTALLAIRELTRLVELQGRFAMEAQQGRASDVANHPVWHRISACILHALEMYPEARYAVMVAVSRELGEPVPALEVQPE